MHGVGDTAKQDLLHLCGSALLKISTSAKIVRSGAPNSSMGCNRWVAGRHVESRENYQLESECVVSRALARARESVKPAVTDLS